MTDKKMAVADCTAIFFYCCFLFRCAYTFGIEGIVLAFYLQSTVSIHNSCIRIKIIFLSIKCQPGSAHFSIRHEIISMFFIISAPCIKYTLNHDAIPTKIIDIIIAVHIPYIFHHITIFCLEIIVILAYFFHAF